MRCALRDFKVKGCCLRLTEGYFGVRIELQLKGFLKEQR